MPWRTILLVVSAVSFLLFVTDGSDGDYVLLSSKTLWAAVFSVCIFLWARTPKAVSRAKIDRIT